MIITKQKPLEEIIKNLKDKKNVLIVGCGGCTTFHRVGGVKEVDELKNKLKENLNINIESIFVARQCSKEMVEKTLKINDYDAIVSTACGAGVQQISEIYDKIPVYPANNTFFVGIENIKESKIMEVCKGCGDCILDKTGGICPKTRCKKALLNGPCAGVHEGLCELSTQENKIPCAWIEIYNKLEKMNMLDKLLEINIPK